MVAGNKYSSFSAKWKASLVQPISQSTYKGRAENRGSVSAFSAGAYTTTLYVTVDIVKGGGRAPLPHTLTRQGWFFHHDGM